MIISNSQIKSLLQDYAKQDAQYSAKKGEVKASKTVQVKKEPVVSETAKAFQMAKSVIREAPEIREERLASIENQVKTGAYEVSDDEIAEKMIGRSLVDKLV